MTSRCVRVNEAHETSGWATLDTVCVSDDGTGGADPVSRFVTSSALPAACRACPTCACLLAGARADPDSWDRRADVTGGDDSACENCEHKDDSGPREMLTASPSPAIPILDVPQE
jgi:hypothetical protein